ncbi:MAG TPA: flagellin, partial [Symbiobacteriaceae bacterium]|nr:flagellin [Symbiobacteriaceae bacterium]
QIKGLNQAVKNAQDGISLLQTAEGSLTEVHNMLHRMRELAVQSANGTLQPEDRKQIQTEMDNLTKEVTRITNATQFNGMDLIDGSLQTSGIRDVSLQIGPNGGQTVTFGIGAMDAESLGIARDVLIGTVDNGEHFDLTATDANVTSINTLGTGLDNTADYQIFVDGTANTYQLQKSTDGGANWSNVGTAVAAPAVAGPITLGVAATNETVEVGAIVAPAADTTLAITNSASIVAKIGEMGAGLSAGSFEVQYDTSNQHLKLVDSATGKDIGAFIDLNNPDVDVTKPLVLGDKNTAQTVEITLKSNLPQAGGVITDNLTVESVVGQVAHDADDMLVDTNGVIGVGTGLKSASYQIVATAANTIQLQDMNGVAIGNAVNVGATGGQVEIGDATTKRTVKIDLNVAAIAANSTAVISVNNREQHADAATFSGGAKQLNAQAYAGLNVSSVEGSQKAIAAIDTAIGKVSYQRSQLGAITNRLEHTISNLNVVSENLTASESRIRDVDMAMEMTQFTKHQILMQSGTAMLAQANQKNQAVLSLLR